MARALSVETNASLAASLRRQAHIAGLCYLAVIAGGIFAALFVRESIFVAGDAEATARAIAANEARWRWGIAVHLMYLPVAAISDVILYRLFKSVGPTLALLALFFSLADIAMEGLLMTSLYLPLMMVGDGGPLSALDQAHRDAFAYLGVRVFLTGWGFALFLFSGFCTLMGVLIVRSRLIPRAVGVLMIAAGASYFINSLAGIVAPGIANNLLPWILLPAFVGESSLALWLTFKGVNVAEVVP